MVVADIRRESQEATRERLCRSIGFCQQLIADDLHFLVRDAEGELETPFTQNFGNGQNLLLSPAWAP